MDEITLEQAAKVKSLIVRADLAGVRFHELTAKLHDDIEQSADDDEAKIDLTYQTRSSGNAFGVRALVSVTAPVGIAQVVVAADYALSEGPVPDAETLELFASEVGVMTLIPYIREALSSLTLRVFGAPIFLPMIQRGDVRPKG